MRREFAVAKRWSGVRGGHPFQILLEGTVVSRRLPAIRRGTGDPRRSGPGSLSSGCALERVSPGTNTAVHTCGNQIYNKADVVGSDALPVEELPGVRCALERFKAGDGSRRLFVIGSVDQLAIDEIFRKEKDVLQSVGVAVAR